MTACTCPAVRTELLAKLSLEGRINCHFHGVTPTTPSTAPALNSDELTDALRAALGAHSLSDSVGDGLSRPTQPPTRTTASAARTNPFTQ